MGFILALKLSKIGHSLAVFGRGGINMLLACAGALGARTGSIGALKSKADKLSTGLGRGEVDMLLE